MIAFESQEFQAYLFERTNIFKKSEIFFFLSTFIKLVE